MINIIRDKRGDPSIVIFSLLCVVLVGLAMSNFVFNPGGIEVTVVDAKLIRNVYLEEAQVGAQLSSFSERALIRTYDSLVGKEGFIESYDSKTGAGFEKAFISNLGEEMKGYSVGILEDLSILETQFDGERFNVSLKDVSSTYVSKNEAGKVVFSSLYYMKSFYEFNITERGLESFGRLKKVYDLCSGKEDAEKCFNDEKMNFNAQIVKDENGKKSIILTSKRKFVIGGELRAIRTVLGSS